MGEGGDDGGGRKCFNSTYILRKTSKVCLWTRCEEGERGSTRSKFMVLSAAHLWTC